MAESSSTTTSAASAQEPSSTFIESSTTYHTAGARSDRDSDHEQDRDQDDDDDDEALFAELDKELDLMEDQGNFGHNGDSTVAGFDMAEFRERRMEELRSEYVRPLFFSPPITLSFAHAVVYDRP